MGVRILAFFTISDNEWGGFVMQSGVPGKGYALASLILGIASLVFCWFYGTSVISGIIGIVMANKANAAGFIGGQSKAGKIMSIIGMILGIIFLILIIIGITQAVRYY